MSEKSSPSSPYSSDSNSADLLPGRKWYHELNRYHWFVLMVAALGWLFDTMDQQLFTLARTPAMTELLSTTTQVDEKPQIAPPSGDDVKYYGGLATSIFLMGWAIGGLCFGVIGDRIGRAKTMMLTILVYSLFTGLSAFSPNFAWFAIFRFLTGLGVGGEFAVGVALVAEVMPNRARPHALGLLQALSAVGNISAALINWYLGILEGTGGLDDITLGGDSPVKAWRLMFLIGMIPALLCILIRAKLKEPERWQAVAVDGAVQKQLGSYRELFGDPRWRRNALVGLVMAFSGVVGLWGIGFFSPERVAPVLARGFAAKVQAAAQLTLGNAGDSELTRKLMESINTRMEEEYKKPKNAVQKAEVVAEITRSAEEALGNSADGASITERVADLVQKADAISFRTKWTSLMFIVQNLGGALGIYVFAKITQRTGRKPAFAVGFVIAAAATAFVFWYLKEFNWVMFVMIFVMGFCQLCLFGGYAIYFPELFPTRLRSTGTSFCYNVGRFVAAIGPFTFGYLTSSVFSQANGFENGIRHTGVALSGIFLLGLLALPFAPETRGQSLPE